MENFLTYPCRHCGECSIWLAAFDPETDLATLGDVISECEKAKCNLVGLKVKEEYCLERLGVKRLIRKKTEF